MRRRRKQGVAKLNITSLLDMFTIMLLFLLVNFAPSDDEAKLHPGLKLPHSESELDAINAIGIVLTPKALLLEDKVVLKLARGKFPKRSVDGDQIKPLYKALKHLKKKYDKKKYRKLAALKKNKKKTDVILFQADQKIKYDLIDKVMITTAQAGFSNFKFAVLKKQ